MNGENVELREAVAALRAMWWLPVLCLIVGGGAAYGASVLATPLYTSSTQLFVSTAGANTPNALTEASLFSEQRVTSYAQLISGQQLASKVVNRLRLHMSPSALADEVSATAVTDTVLINIDVTDPSPRRAQLIAATIGDEFATYAQQLEAPGPGGTSPVRVTVTEQAQLPSVPSSPKSARNVALGGGLGLLAGAGLAIARARLDRTVKATTDAAHLAQAPVIGTVLRDPTLEKQHLIHPAVASRAAEDYRQLRTNLQFINVDEPPRVIMVSSALPAEGKTTLVINLALVLSEAGQNVTVVEADLRRPKVTQYLGMISGAGLTNVLAGTADLDDVMQTFRERMTVIAAGPIPPNPGELLASTQMAGALGKLRSRSDFVIIDAPPLLPVADSSGLAVHTDGVVLAVRYGSTRKEQLGQAAVNLDRVGAKVLGVVLNIVPPKAEIASAYGYGYNYGYGGGNGSN